MIFSSRSVVSFYLSITFFIYAHFRSYKKGDKIGQSATGRSLKYIRSIGLRKEKKKRSHLVDEIPSSKRLSRSLADVSSSCHVDVDVNVPLSSFTLSTEAKETRTL